MNAYIVEATIKAQLTEVRAKLEKGLRIAKAAEACAVSGRNRKGIEVAVGLEKIVAEVNTILNATVMIHRLGKT
jgi:hypothetical protein